MNILLLRPHPGNDKFGLGPFFCVEPLGLEYIASALLRDGHKVTIADLRFRPALKSWIRRSKPLLVGISCLHTLEFDRVIETAREVKRLVPDAFVLVGGHAAAAFSSGVEDPAVDAVMVEDGEMLTPMLAEYLEAGISLEKLPGLRLKTGDGWISTAVSNERPSLDLVSLPARQLVEQHRSGYHCLLFKPVWLVETARGCPHRCSFCSVWQLYDRTCRERSIEAVVEDFATTGDAIFVADDLFWHNPARSMELAAALKKRGVYKRWILVQTRTDLICRSAEIMAAWRPLAKDFDIFLGLEAASDNGLADLDKDSGIKESIEAVRIARDLKYGINGNFLVDPDWDEDGFSQLWHFVQQYSLQRAGFTILTPLPGTDYYQSVTDKTKGQPWANFDMHHLLWEPKLGADRFFELYAETWKRSILNTAGDKGIMDWIKQVRPSQIPYIIKVLWRTQNMMKPAEYMKEYLAASVPSRRSTV